MEYYLIMKALVRGETFVTKKIIMALMQNKIKETKKIIFR